MTSHRNCPPWSRAVADQLELYARRPSPAARRRGGLRGALMTMIMIMPPRRVPCGTCTVCCETERVYLHPEYGDDPTIYRVQSIGDRLALAQAENGDCIYLVRGNGCSYHDIRPSMCRGFDCRTLLRLSDEDIAHCIETGLVSPRVFAAAARLRVATAERVRPTTLGRRRRKR